MFETHQGEWYGLPFDLIDWQEEFIRDVFGTINTKTGTDNTILHIWKYRKSKVGQNRCRIGIVINVW